MLEGSVSTCFSLIPTPIVPATSLDCGSYLRVMAGSQAEIENMSPSKKAMRPESYEALFAHGLLAQSLDSAHSEDSGFLQYVHLPSQMQPETMALYATPRTIDSGFHHRHSAPSMVGSTIGSYIMQHSPCLNPVNPSRVPGGPAINKDAGAPNIETLLAAESLIKDKSAKAPLKTYPVAGDWIARSSSDLPWISSSVDLNTASAYRYDRFSSDLIKRLLTLLFSGLGKDTKTATRSPTILPLMGS